MTDVSFAPDEEKYVPPTIRPVPEARSVAGDQAAVPRLMQYIRIAIRWKWLILGSIALAVLIGVVVTVLATPFYTAATTLEISREGVRVVSNMNDVEPETQAGDMEFYQTQYGLLRSRAIAERVTRQLRLAENVEFFTMFGQAEALERASAGVSSHSMQAREIRQRKAIDILLANVDVSPTRLSRLVAVSFTSPNPSFSAQVTNAWATAFIESSLERRFEATAYARHFLEQRLEQLRQRLEESERQLVAYASQQAIINIPIPGPDGSARPQERSLIADSLAALNTELAQAMADRIRAQSRVRASGGGAEPEALANQAISLMRQRRSEVAAERSRLLTQFEPAYPAVQALTAQLQQIDQGIAREETRVQRTLANTYTDSLQRERTLTAQVDNLKQQFLDQRRRGIQYNIFQREVDTNRELYDGLLQRYKEVGITGGVGANNISVVDRAQVPERPSQPRPLINLIIALLAGTVIGVGLALAREQIDETIADPADLDRKLDLPFLGAIPKSSAEDVIAEVRDPKSSVTEAYLSVQTNLGFSTDHGIPRALSITSTRPAEGKSVTSYAISHTIASSGARTLLIDADMRSPSVHRLAGLRNEKGLSNYLSGTDDIHTLIQQPPGEPFAVLSAGPQPPNAADLLRSNRLELLLAELATRFDHVVIDSPPVVGLADAPIIASQVEAVVFVLEARGVTARGARLALGRLRQARARLLGVVLTKFEAKRAHYGYGYDYGYGYGSSDHEKAKA
jgi:succinoglycan biosynthesis transport protein ExoP